MTCHSFVRYLVVLVLLLSFGKQSVAANCTKDAAIAAESEAAKLNDWNEIFLSYKRFGHCDDGAIAQGYSVSVVRTLELKWSELPRLHTLITQDEMFRQFVLRHINDTAPTKSLDEIERKARESCPNDATTLCSSIVMTIERLRGRKN